VTPLTKGGCSGVPASQPGSCNMEEPPTGAYIGHRRGAQLNIALLGRTSSILLGWVAPLISAGAGEIFDGCTTPVAGSSFLREADKRGCPASQPGFCNRGAASGPEHINRWAGYPPSRLAMGGRQGRSHAEPATAPGAKRSRRFKGSPPPPTPTPPSP
jgi:hypothetical protein